MPTSDNPLVHGLIHEARAQIAHAAGREGEFAQSAAEVERWLRPLGNPALIAKCERLSGLRMRGRAECRARARTMKSGAGSTCSRVTTAGRSASVHGLELLRRAADAPGAALYRRRGDGFVLAAQTVGATFGKTPPDDVLAGLRSLEHEHSDVATGSAPFTSAPVRIELAARVDTPVRDAYLLLADPPGRELVGAVVLNLARGTKAPPMGLLRALARTLDQDDATVAEPTRPTAIKRFSLV